MPDYTRKSSPNRVVGSVTEARSAVPLEIVDNPQYLVPGLPRRPGMFVGIQLVPYTQLEVLAASSSSVVKL